MRNSLGVFLALHSLYFSSNSLDLIPSSLQCKLCRTETLAGQVGDCDCDFETVDSATHAYFHPLLNRLQQTAYFRYFKVNLDEACPFWDDSDALCAMKDCAVETCVYEEIPLFLRFDDSESNDSSALSKKFNGRDNPCNSVVDEEANVDSEQSLTLGSVARAVHLLNTSMWSEGSSSDVWIDQDEASGMVYVDLLENPERYTGYSGPHARRVWQAIHEENCFEIDFGDRGQCLEKRIFFRLISGLQASINTHIATNYLFGGAYGEGGHWGPNTQLFVDRVGRHSDRLHNLYFTYLFLLRALAKAAPALEASHFDTGHAEEDSRSRALVRALVRPDHPLLDASQAAQVCQRGFDESRLFQMDSELEEGMTEFEQYMAMRRTLELRKEFQERFRNISRIMDCVGCEKCRLWGKLQVLGIGTALKILMSREEEGEITLQRNEAIALLNTLAQLSTSVQSVQLWRQRELRSALFLLLGRVGVVALLGIGLHVYRKRSGRAHNTHAKTN